MGSKCTPSALIVRFLYPNSIKSLAITTLLAFNISLSLSFFLFLFFIKRPKEKIVESVAFAFASCFYKQSVQYRTSLGIVKCLRDGSDIKSGQINDSNLSGKLMQQSSFRALDPLPLQLLHLLALQHPTKVTLLKDSTTR